jgi:hypothetical protein
VVTDANGCTGASADHVLRQFPDAAVPVISRSGDTLTSTPAAGWQWYRNGQPIAGATARTYVTSLDGSYTVRIADANGCHAFSDAVVISKLVAIVTAVNVPLLQAAPGERVIVPVRLVSQNNIQALSPRDFSAELRFNKTLLFPTGATPLGTVQGRERVIPFRGAFADLRTPLAELSFIALLGDSDRTPLRLGNFTWADARASVVTSDGEFLVTVCREGGTRLFLGDAQFGVAAHPNPFNASTVIEYTTIGTGAAQLFVLDALGRRVATLADGPREPGTHRTVFDASNLSSGMYRVLLVAEGLSSSVLLMLAK